MNKSDILAIYATNPRRVNKFFDLEIDDQNLAENKDFLEKLSEYEKYFTNKALTDKDVLREFYDKTGLVLAYEVGDIRGRCYFSMHGRIYSREGKWFREFRDEDILVTSKTGIMELVASLQENEGRAELSERTRKLNYERSFASGMEEQVEVLAKFVEKEFDKAEIKQIAANIFGEVFVLYGDGRLLRNFEPYEEKVEGIFEADSLNKYLIFKDNTVEALSWEANKALLNGKYDKVVFDKHMMAVLKDRRLYVVTQAWKQADMSVVSSFAGVDDMEIVHDWGENEVPPEEMLATKLWIKSGGSEIAMNGVPIVEEISEEKVNKDEIRKEIMIRQRLRWLELDKKKGEFDIDNLAEVIDHVDNFYIMAPNILGASNEKFERFFEKLYRYDKRILMFFLVANREKITAEQWKFAQDFYGEEIPWEKVEKMVGNKKG